ncbi:redoxin family protein [Sulfurovum sp. NBC37-1]|uniref:redoxin family protein n=1 Tax=Sulfurovum sp. (strain NBC37-1) TaxID=387093 RepID=UPI0001587637|nr:redoxin family protein [Sulfurovum sp. NBC37-1]BAF71858.1 thioredoxin [Sulfurovum sp. NBC37-1]
MNVKKWVKEILIGAALLFILSNIISYVRKPDLDSLQLPIETVQLVDGSTYSLKPGKPVIVHFWATWCPACKLEAANIERVSKKYEVLTIAVNSGSDKKIRQYLEKRGLDFRVVNDKEGSWARKFKVQAFPMTFIYNAEGRLKFTEVGYTTTAGLLARMTLID